MAQIPSIDELRKWLTRDQLALEVMSERLRELETMSAEELTASSGKLLSTWDRSVITECNKHLDAMEKIEISSQQERSIMIELHKLVQLGDHMLERVNIMQATIKEKTSKSGGSRKSKTPPKAVPAMEHEEEIESLTMSNPRQAAIEDRRLPTFASVVSPSDKSAAPPNNTLIYDLLGVAYDASSTDIKKAIRKQTMSRHPDRLPDDADASTKFADFKILCAVVEDDETREEYDETGEVEDVDDLPVLIERLRLT